MGLAPRLPIVKECRFWASWLLGELFQALVCIGARDAASHPLVLAHVSTTLFMQAALTDGFVMSLV